MVAMQGFVSSAERIGAALAGGAVLLVGGSVAASSLLASFPVLGGQAVRYSAAALLLAGWSVLRGQPLSRPVGSEWTWLVALAAVGMAACSVLLIEATRFADPAAVGVVIGAAPPVPSLMAGPGGIGACPGCCGRLRRWPGWPAHRCLRLRCCPGSGRWLSRPTAAESLGRNCSPSRRWSPWPVALPS
jgi:hypothetical protein